MIERRRDHTTTMVMAALLATAAVAFAMSGVRTPPPGPRDLPDIATQRPLRSAVPAPIAPSSAPTAAPTPGPAGAAASGARRSPAPSPGHEVVEPFLRESDDHEPPPAADEAISGSISAAAVSPPAGDAGQAGPHEPPSWTGEVEDAERVDGSR